MAETGVKYKNSITYSKIVLIIQVLQVNQLQYHIRNSKYIIDLVDWEFYFYKIVFTKFYLPDNF